MSDSDDTDVLLLIPPDFFVTNNSVNNSQENIYQLDLKTEFLSMSGNYQHLPPRHQIELETIDARLSEIEKNFSTSSEISEITNKTLKSYPNCRDFNNENGKKNPLSPRSNLCHSTPKYSSMPKELVGDRDRDHKEQDFINKEIHTDNVINEIDRFLENTENSKYSSIPHASSNEFLLWDKPGCFGDGQQYSIFENNRKLPHKHDLRENDDNKLLSLNEIWNSNGGDGTKSLHEEHLRRQHCEKIIQALQSKLLEYQQKISVAIHIDKVKNGTIEKLQEENRRLKSFTNDLDQKLLNFEKLKSDLNEKIQLESEEFKTQKEKLEKELSQALNLVTKFQDKNEILEIRVENLTRASDEIGLVYKKQIEDLEARLTNTHKSREITCEEINKLKIQHKHLQESYEKITKENNELKKQTENQICKLEQMKRENEVCSKKIDELEIKNKAMEEVHFAVTNKEKNFLKELENQRISLKSYYQQQLENIVAEKLKEFQSQLDSVEESFKERERVIAERAIKQVEMINEKNEQEINLLNEKHKEEVELYRIQLANSSKKIDDLEEKLNEYRSRRADIAEKLHKVMETQWRKALDILISPSSVNSGDEFSKINPQNVDQEKLDGLRKCSNKSKCKPENENFETPISSRYRKKINDQENIDRLQAYIEMLLNKSPTDLDNLQEILEMPKVNTTNSRHQSGKIERNKSGTCENTSKPPWK